MEDFVAVGDEPALDVFGGVPAPVVAGGVVVVEVDVGGVEALGDGEPDALGLGVYLLGLDDVGLV